MATFYVDYANGTDATATPFGWWGVAYTAGTVSSPAIDTTITGATSGRTAKVSHLTLTSGTWAGGNAAGTIWIYGKSGAFVSEQVNVTGGGKFNIAGDFPVVAWKTIGAGSSGKIAAGDTLRIAKTMDATSLGDATWTDGSPTVTLATAQTATIDNCETAWTTGGGDVATPTRNSTNDNVSQGTYCAYFTFDSAVQTNIKQAYFTLPAQLDLSSYQMVSFWVYTTAAVAGADRLRINLCSDTLGAVVVDTIAVPITIAGVWTQYQVARTGGGNLGSTINSIALYTGGTSPGNSISVGLDNIIACTTTGLSHSSLISKNSSSTQDITGEQWYAIRSIDGTTVVLDSTNSTNASMAYATEGTSPATVTTYYRNPYKTTPGNNNNFDYANIAGNSTNRLTYSYGWNTATNTVDGMTWVDAASRTNGTYNVGKRFFQMSQNFTTISGCGAVRFRMGFPGYTLSSNDVTISQACVHFPYDFNTTAFSTGTFRLQANGCAGVGSSFNAQASSSTFQIYNVACSEPIYQGGLSNTYELNIKRCILADVKIQLDNCDIRINSYGNNTYTFMRATTNPITNCINNVLRDSTFKLASGTISNFIQANAGPNRFVNLTFLSPTTGGAIAAQSGAIVSAKNITTQNTNYGSASASASGQTTLGMDIINGDPNLSRVYDGKYTAIMQQTERHTASGYAWQVTPTSTNVTATAPGIFNIAKVACTGGKLVTFNAWVKLSHATDIGARIITRALYTPGISSNQIATKTADTDWQELTITFTPTYKCVVEIDLEAYWLANLADESVYVDDITVTEAA